MEKLLLVDGHSLLHRTFYGLPDLTNSHGLHTNAILGFFHILMRMLEEEKPDYVTVAFDVSEPTFRHKLYKHYKGTRKPMPEELMQQVPVMKDLLKAMKIPIVEKSGYEADDILGTIARMGEREGMKVVLVSGDKDLLQIASDRVKIRIPKTKKGVTEIEDYVAEDVKKVYGVTPEQFIDLKALMGDSSDNIPGLPGVGEKTAAKIIQAFGSIEQAREHLEEITPAKAREAMREHFDLAQLSKTLATIKTDCELNYLFEKLSIQDLFNEDSYEMFHKLEFKSLLKKYFGDIKVKHEDSIKEHFNQIEDLCESEKMFENAKRQSVLALSFLSDKKHMIGLSIAFGENAWFLPAKNFLNEDYLKQKVEELGKLEKTLLFFDLKRNLSFFPQLENFSCYDIEIAAYLLNPLKDTYDYEDIARDYLDLTLVSRKELFGKALLEEEMEQKPNEFLAYACYQSKIPLMAFPVLKEKLLKEGMWKLYDTIEMPLVYTLYHMEQAGVSVNQKELERYGKRLGEKISEVEKEIYSKVGKEFNINSPKQLGEILFDKMGLTGGKKTKTGYSTAADVLEKLAPEYPVVQKILEYRQLTNLKSTYADGLSGFIESDGRIHSTFHQTITATGRISSTDPNLQNIPIRMEIGREIRRVFVPQEGYVFLDADYSQIELRVLAHLSGDKCLIDAYQQAKDIHRITASQVFHVPFEEVTELQRRNAKAVNFGIIYGISSFGLSQDLSIEKKEAQEYIEQYFKAYPQIKDFIDGLVASAKEKGYTETMYGRRRPLPEIASPNFTQRSFGERIAMNAPIQGTAADIIKIAMNHVDERLHREHMKSRLILQVHDELLIEAEQSELEQVKAILEEEMVHASELAVKLEIDMHTGKNWMEAK